MEDQWYTVHIQFPAKDDRAAIVRADEIVKKASKHSKTYIDRKRWDVSDSEDWAEQIRTWKPSSGPGPTSTERR